VYEHENGSYRIVLYRKSSHRDTTTATATATQTAEKTGRWAFAEAPTLSLDELKTFMTHLKAGIELELDYKEDAHAEIDNKTSDFFGMYIMRYHAVPQCPVCGRDGCWEHVPPKLVRAIQKDASIVGNEFLIYGSSEPSEEFAEQLKPVIEFLSQHYKVTMHNSAHVHLLVTDDYSPVPITVAYNFWQLMRYFYPGYAWVFGNTPESFLRKSGYSGFQDLLSSPLFDRVGEIGMQCISVSHI